MLPDIARLLETTIDSILIPRALVILDGFYTCGEGFIRVTDALNKAVVNNTLHIDAKCPIGGHSITGPAVFVLTVKYKTPDGTFFAFAPQEETLHIDLSAKGLPVGDKIELVGAYCGTGRKYICVTKQLADFVRGSLNEIPFRSGLYDFGTNAGCFGNLEYLTVVYTNSSGIKVIGGKSGGTLCRAGTTLYFKDI